MDCGTQGELCDNLDVSSSTTAYFPPGATINNKEKGGVLVWLACIVYLVNKLITMLKECINHFQTDDTQLKRCFLLFCSKLVCSAWVHIPVSAQAVMLEVIPVCRESEHSLWLCLAASPGASLGSSGRSGQGSALWLAQELHLTLLPSCPGQAWESLLPSKNW